MNFHKKQKASDEGSLLKIFERERLFYDNFLSDLAISVRDRQDVDT